MIECSREELAGNGFIFLPGNIEGILYQEELYGFKEILPKEQAFLGMKLCGKSYSPHRAKDYQGKEYGETELLYGERFAFLEDLEGLGALVDFLKDGTLLNSND